MKCETLYRLLGVVPGMRLKGYLVERHESRCPECRKDKDWTAFLNKMPPDSEKIDLWTVVRNQLPDRPCRNRTSWFSTGRWVLAGATVTASILLIVPLVKPTPKRITFDITTVNPVIHTLSLAEKPARLVYFKVDNPGRLIVWASSSDLSPQEEIKK